MRRLRVSREAEEDLLEIWRYVSEKSETAAVRLITEINARYETLLDHPQMGRSREELGPDYRSLVVGNYVLFYRLIEEGIEIARVLHGARDTLPLFQPDEE